MLERGRDGSKLRNAPLMLRLLEAFGAIKEAVPSALALPRSNGLVEGQIHRLKLINQMYDRSGFDLLRLRVLHSA